MAKCIQLHANTITLSFDIEFNKKGRRVWSAYDLQFYQLQLEKSQGVKLQRHHPW